MSKYRRSLPQLGGRLFLTDGGIETTLIFHDGLELPYFAAFALLVTPEGTDALRRYFRGYAALAAKHGAGLILESPTWRASADWASKLGYTSDQLADANLTAMSLLEDIRRESETDRTPVVVSGCVGPRGDGYVPDQAMSEADAAQYHRAQIETFAASAADMVCAITMNYTAEAAGIVRAARQAAMPVAISFTFETDGRLPTGQTLKDAIAAVDASTDSYPSYYMINCAHPTHFESVLDAGESSTRRIRGLRANASRMSHAELNEAPALDEGDPVEFGREYAALTGRLGWVNVLGGCCGTDDRHVDQIARACAPLFTA